MNDRKTTIYLVRHGESVGNLNKICLGHTDLGLTEKGEKQAKMTALELKNVHFAAIYSSDLVRAVKTAQPHAEIRGLNVVKTPMLRELYFGEWENKAVDWIKDTYGDMFTVGWRVIFGDFTPPGGEYVPHMAERVAEELKNIARMHKGENILVTSHAAAIRALWGKISGFEPCDWGKAHPYPTNASYSVIEFEEETLIPIRYSIDSHLSEIASPLPG